MNVLSLGYLRVVHLACAAEAYKMNVNVVPFAVVLLT